MIGFTPEYQVKQIFIASNQFPLQNFSNRVVFVKILSSITVEYQYPGFIMLRYRDLLLVAPESRGAMNSLRKWLYRPRRDDKSLLAKFW